MQFFISKFEICVVNIMNYFTGFNCLKIQKGLGVFELFHQFDFYIFDMLPEIPFSSRGKLNYLTFKLCIAK